MSKRRKFSAEFRRWGSSLGRRGLLGAHAVNGLGQAAAGGVRHTRRSVNSGATDRDKA